MFAKAEKSNKRDKRRFIESIDQGNRCPDEVTVTPEQAQPGSSSNDESINNQPFSQHTPELQNPRCRNVNENPKQIDERMKKKGQ